MEAGARLQEIQAAIDNDPEVPRACDSDTQLIAGGQCRKRVISTKQHKSSDVEIHTTCPEDVDTLVRAKAWVSIFGAEATAHSNTFSVVAHGIQVKDVNLKGPDNIRTTAEAIVAANALK